MTVNKNQRNSKIILSTCFIHHSRAEYENEAR